MKSAKFAFLLLLVLNIGFASDKSVEWPSIKLSLDNLSQHYPTVSVEISKDPVYQRDKKYLAIALQPLVKTLAEHYPDTLKDAAVVFTALDGYQAVMPYSTVLEREGFLAFKDLAAKLKNWIPFRFGQHSIMPAPFYLVWPDLQKQEKWRFAWPFQLASIQLKPSRLIYKDAAPKSPNKTILEGFGLFSQFCIRCHTINGSGGTVGPDLTSPNPTTIYAESILMQRILNAKKFNPTTKMPVFKNVLSTEQIIKIIRYLEGIHVQDATNNAIH